MEEPKCSHQSIANDKDPHIINLLTKHGQIIIQLINAGMVNEQLNIQILQQREGLYGITISIKFLQENNIGSYKNPSQLYSKISMHPESIIVDQISKIIISPSDKLGVFTLNLQKRQMDDNFNNKLKIQKQKLAKRQENQLKLKKECPNQVKGKQFLVQRKYQQIMFSMRNVNTNNEFLKIEVTYLQTIETFTAEINKQSLISNKLIEFLTPNELFEQLQQHSDGIKCLQNGLITFVLKWGKINRVKQIQTLKQNNSIKSLQTRVINLQNNLKQHKSNNNQLNKKNQLLLKQNFTLKQQINQIMNQVLQIKQKEIKEVKSLGIIFNNIYVRFGWTKLKGYHYYYLIQGPKTTTKNAKVQWKWFQIIDSKFLLQTYKSEQFLCATKQRTLQTRNKIQAQSRWIRIHNGTKSMWLSCYNTYLSVNSNGQLYLQDNHVMAPESLWTDTIVNDHL